MLDKRSFVLGMVTAFCECVAGGCKRLALSPPLSSEEYEALGPEAEQIIERHGLLHYHETNKDIPEGERFEWIVIAGRQQTLDSYLALRAGGLSPARSLTPFAELLSYDAEQSVHGLRRLQDLFSTAVKAYFISVRRRIGLWNVNVISGPM